MNELENQHFEGEKEKTEELKSSEDIRLYIAELIKDKNKLSSEIWDLIFKSPENVRAYLEKNNLLDKNWKSSEWLSENRYGAFYAQAVRLTSKERKTKRFDKWAEFLEWMGEEARENWDEVFKSPEHERAYLVKNDLLNKNWKSSEWLQKNGCGAFYQQVVQKTTISRPTQRFKYWNDFLVWMGEKNTVEVEEKINWDEILKSPEHVRAYLEENNLLRKNWSNSNWLRKSKYYVLYQQACMQRTISRPNLRFKSWKDFLLWMGEITKDEVKEKTNWDEVLNKQENVREFLKENNILDKNWISSYWLENNGYVAFYQQAVKYTSKECTNPRFSSWKAFLIWMGVRESRHEEIYPISEDIIKKIREEIKDEF